MVATSRRQQALLVLLNYLGQSCSFAVNQLSSSNMYEIRTNRDLY
jgi:hypothetical protein